MFNFRTRIIWLGNNGIFSRASFLISFSALVIPSLAYSSVLRIGIGGGVILVLASILIYARFIASTVAITCVPKEGNHTAKEQHHGEYLIKEGYAKFNVYVHIPRYLSEVKVDIDISDSFTIAAWNYTDDVEFSESYQSFEYSGGDNFNFDLELDGEVDDLAGEDFSLGFIDKKTGVTVESLTLEPIAVSEETSPR